MYLDEALQMASLETERMPIDRHQIYSHGLRARVADSVFAHGLSIRIVEKAIHRSCMS